MFGDKKVNTVYKTKDLKKFKRIEGNRPVNKAHLSNLVESIKEKNLLLANPITITDSYEVIDGQHRLEAARELGLEIYYIKVESLKLEDVQRLNRDTRNWKPIDFASAYAELGNKEYVTYLQFVEKWNLPYESALQLLSGYSPDKKQTRNFRAGKFKVKQLKKANEYAQMLHDFKKYYSRFKRRSFTRAALKMFEVENYDHAWMLKKLKYLQRRLVDCVSIEETLRLLEEIYNHRRGGDYVRFF